MININILMYLVEIFSEIVIIYFFSRVYSKKIILCKKNNIIFILISFGLFIVNYNQFGIIKWIYTFIMVFILYYIFIENNLKSSIKNTVFFCIIILIIDIIIALLSNIFFGSFFTSILLNDYYKLVLSFIENLIIFILAKVKLLNRFTNKIINRIKNNDEKYLYLFCCTTIYISMSVILYNVVFKEIKIMYFLILIISCSLILIYSQLAILKLQEKNTQNKSLIELNKFYGNLLEEDKIYKHNIKNKLLTIKSIGNIKVNKLIDEYLNEEPTSARETNNLYNVPNSIKGIICEKVYHFKWTKIVVNNQLKTDPYKNIDLNIYRKLCEIISISLDNAIEATEQLKNGYIFLNFYYEKDSNIIEIINNFDEKLDVDKLGNKNYSTKSRGSGFGLYSVLKSKEITTNYKINNNNFIVKIEIKKPKVR